MPWYMTRVKVRVRVKAWCYSIHLVRAMNSLMSRGIQVGSVMEVFKRQSSNNVSAQSLQGAAGKNLQGAAGMPRAGLGLLSQDRIIYASQFYWTRE